MRVFCHTSFAGKKSNKDPRVHSSMGPLTNSTRACGENNWLVHVNCPFLGWVTKQGLALGHLQYVPLSVCCSNGELVVSQSRTLLDHQVASGPKSQLLNYKG